MSTPLKQRIFQAKQWLIENPDESLYVAAKIFKVNRSTLASAKRRGTLFSTNSKPHGGQNRILTAAQGQAVHAYIKSLLENSQLPTKEIIFSAICHVRKQANQPSPTIKLQPKIIKMCLKEVEILVPIEITELYSLSPENQRSITIIEAICADKRALIPLVLIIQGKYHMASWYGKDQLNGSELVELTDHGYTTDYIGLRFLQHFITYTKASLT
ncbi:hypothetical protein B7463_g8744, partial [Scytalidium lignicola]